MVQLCTLEDGIDPMDPSSYSDAPQPYLSLSDVAGGRCSPSRGIVRLCIVIIFAVVVVVVAVVVVAVVPRSSGDRVLLNIAATALAHPLGRHHSPC